MNINKWTVALAAAGVVSFASVSNAQEAKETVKTLAASTTLSGYVSTSVNWTPGNTDDNGQYRSFNSAKSDRIALDVISLTLASKAGEGEWAAGYKATLWAGPDATALDTGEADNNVAIKNAYISLRAPLGSGVDLKLGVFDTIIGYESTDRNVNPFYSHSWGFTFEPTQHTGLLASYRMSDSISLSVGIANTTDAAINAQAANNSRKTYMAAATLTAPDSFGFLKGASVTGGFVSGRRSDTGAHAVSDQNYYVGATIPTPIKDLSFGFAWDRKSLSGSVADILGDDVDVTGAIEFDIVSAYLSYKVSDKLTASYRGEVIMVDGSADVGSVTGNIDRTLAWAHTVGLDYKLWANVTSRLEYRLEDSALLKEAGASDRRFGQSVTANVIYNF